MTFLIHFVQEFPCWFILFWRAYVKRQIKFRENQIGLISPWNAA